MTVSGVALQMSQKNNQWNQGLYSPTILKNILCLILQDFVNLNVTQLLVG